MFKTHRAQIRLILFLVIINVVVSCLVTNCPRGGKRGLGNSVISSKLKRCKLCDSWRGMCTDDTCLTDNDCDDEGLCVTKEVCCSKKLCKLHHSCRPEYSVEKQKDLQPTSMILTKILAFTLNHANEFMQSNH